jgi:N-acetylmuramoyl-L-alanine amidase
MPMSIDTSLDADWRPAANFEPRKGGERPSILLMHYTGMHSADRALRWLCAPESRVSCHYLIDEAGRITQMVSETMRAWHAGESYWAGETDINSASIGIEVHNPGHGSGYTDFADRQMQAVEALSQDIIARHGIAAPRVLAHSDVAPRRKQDPGEKFDWGRLAGAGVGFWVEPARIEGDAGLSLGDEGGEVERVQRQLAAYGYEIAPTGRFYEDTEIVVAAFQRHFRPALRLQLDLAVILAVPIMYPGGVDVDHHHAFRVDAIVEPVVEIGRPVRLELLLVADHLGLPLDSDGKGLGSLERQRHFRIALDVGDHPGVLPGEIIGVPVILDVAIVAHRPRRDFAAFGVRRQHGNVDLPHFLGEVGQSLCAHDQLRLL